MAQEDKAGSAPENEDDVDVIAPLVGEYYDWLAGKGGRSGQEILEQVKLSPNQRRLFLDRCDDVLVIYGITAPIREANRRKRGGGPPPGRHRR